MKSFLDDVSCILTDFVSLKVIKRNKLPKQTKSKDIPIDRLGVPSDIRNVSSLLQEMYSDNLPQPHDSDGNIEMTTIYQMENEESWLLYG